MMYELPLFPLNTVLFPGMPLKLHIFEERYKLMINRCYADARPFGVTLIRRGREVGGAADPFPVGCTAQITEVEPLVDGRMNIVAVGVERFRILSLKRDEPYLIGMVENLPVSPAEPDLLDRDSRALRGWVRHYLQLLAQASDSKIDLEQLPGDPLRLAYLASFLVQIPARQKQDLLGMSQTGELLSSLRGIYRREVTLLQAMIQANNGDDIGPFSPN
jgi:Lon protease-like protein